MTKQNKFEKRSLWLFFAITYVFSWLFWIPDALMANGVPMPPAFAEFLSSPFNPAAFGPLVAALFLTCLENGIGGVIALLKRGINFHFQKVWLIPIFALLPLIYGSAALLAQASGWMMLDFTNFSIPVIWPMAFVSILFLGGPLEEEFGWRGYALDRLQERFNALTSSIVLGIFWALWHLPAAFAHKLMVGPELFWIFTIQIVLTSVLFTWIYNNTGKSIFTVLFLHTMNNFTHWLVIPSMKMTLGIGVCSILVLAIAVTIILILWGPKKLVREKQMKTTSPNSG